MIEPESSQETKRPSDISHPMKRNTLLSEAEIEIILRGEKMDPPEILRSIEYWARFFDDPNEAKTLLMNSIFVIPVYYKGEDGYFDIGSYFSDKQDTLREHFRDPVTIFAINELKDFIAEANDDFIHYFRFPGETRKHRHERRAFENTARKRFISWYKENKGCYPGTDYTTVRFFSDYLTYENAFPEAKCKQEEEYEGYDDF